MTDRQRKIEALRALAERPGTPAEGEVARKKLAELEAQEPSKSAGKTFRELFDEMEPATYSNKATVDITLEDLRRAHEELKRAFAEREYWKRSSGETERRNAERMKAEAERVESERKKREEEDRIRRENLERLKRSKAEQDYFDSTAQSIHDYYFRPGFVHQAFEAFRADNPDLAQDFVDRLEKAINRNRNKKP